MNSVHNIPMPVTQTRTLAQIRKAAGHTAMTVAPVLAAKLGKPSVHFSTVLKHEANGVSDHYILKAYSEIYGVDIEQVAEAARRPQTL